MARELAMHGRRGGPERCAAVVVALVLVLGAATSQAAETDLVDPAARSPPEGECVVLLHGLGRTHRSMDRIEAALRGEGFTTANIS